MIQSSIRIRNSDWLKRLLKTVLKNPLSFPIPRDKFGALVR